MRAWLGYGVHQRSGFGVLRFTTKIPLTISNLTVWEKTVFLYMVVCYAVCYRIVPPARIL